MDMSFFGEGAPGNCTGEGLDVSEFGWNVEKSESQNELSSFDCRLFKFDDELEDEDVDSAGAVVLVTTCRLTWRGK
jgi:hypothetical protein